VEPCGTELVCSNITYQTHKIHILDGANTMVHENDVKYIYQGESAGDPRRDVTTVQVDSRVTEIEDYAFVKWTSLRYINLPRTIACIGHYAFNKCSALTAVTLPSTITKIGEGVFKGCSSLASVMLPPTITTISHFAFSECTSLISLQLPENLAAISITAFTGCSNLTTIKSPSLSTITFDKHVRDVFIEAGFSLVNPQDVMLGRPKSVHHFSMIYYEWKVWARLRGIDGRLPLFTAVAKSLPWSCLRQIFIANMPGVNEIDELTGLPVFMLAAIGQNSSIESIYNLLKECPTATNISSNIYSNIKRKRVGE